MRTIFRMDYDGEVESFILNICNKPDQLRIAKATGIINCQPDTIQLIKSKLIKKGDVLSIAEFAGIQAAKKTSELIPLCHPLMITKIDVKASIENSSIRVNAETRCIGKTGIEMEALTAVSVALLTIYDMCKAVDKEMVISEMRLVEKTKI